MKKRLVAAATLAAAACIGVAQVSSAANAPGSAAVPRGGELHLTKECSAYTGLADQHCTITSSNVNAIKAGSRVVYLQQAVGAALDSDLIVVVGPGNYALGHVTLDLASGTGRIVLSGGAGQFRAFHARAAVSPLGGVNHAWDGRYHFGRHHE